MLIFRKILGILDLADIVIIPAHARQNRICTNRIGSRLVE